MDDKDKSVIENLVDTVKSKVGEAVKNAVMPSQDPEEEALAKHQQMLVGDAAIAPEAMPSLALFPSKKRAAPKRTIKQVAKAAKKPAAKAAKKSKAKKSAKKATPKKKSKAASKKTITKKDAKKKKAKKSKR
jgi:hypothetical protein